MSSGTHLFAFGSAATKIVAVVFGYSEGQELEGAGNAKTQQSANLRMWHNGQLNLLESNNELKVHFSLLKRFSGLVVALVCISSAHAAENGTTARDVRFRALTAYAKGDSILAISILNEALKKGGKEEQSHTHADLAEIYFKLGKIEQATSELSTAKKGLRDNAYKCRIRLIERRLGSLSAKQMTAMHDDNDGSQDSIGECWMEEDGTIKMRLIALAPGLRGHGEFTYAPDHAQYEEVLKHVGPLKPGEKKLVPPWD